MSADISEYVIVSVVSDDPFAIDVAHFFGQTAEISDVVSLKQFANQEYCPRFIRDENDFDNIGWGLKGKGVVIVSTYGGEESRNALAMRTCLLARAAKDNGAEEVVLAEPDLFYSAQDRGPRREHGGVLFERDEKDLKKFDGQPFSSLLYAQLLREAGIDRVLTVHNHSTSVKSLFRREMNGGFYNLSPASLYADYIVRHEAQPEESLFLCAPDQGAADFVEEVAGQVQEAMADLLIKPKVDTVFLNKKRTGERAVYMEPSGNSSAALQDIRGHPVIVLDDMVRTGSTIVKCCELLKEWGASRVIFVVTHFYPSDEVKENLNSPAIDEIVTTNTLPLILNRDMQGRLRKKMLLLKVEKWIAAFLRNNFCELPPLTGMSLFSIDVSAKNPRCQEHLAKAEEADHGALSERSWLSS